MFGIFNGILQMKNSTKNFSKTDNPILYFLGMDE